MECFVAGKKIRVTPANSIGGGGEADVFAIGDGLALKIFKPPSHPDFAANAFNEEAARLRIGEHQTKLKNFPKNLPERVITPRDLALKTPGGPVIGYSMPLVKNAEALHKYSERTFRERGVPNSTVQEIFIDLHHTMLKLHEADVVAGDFNDLNVLVKNKEAYLIDADSFQFGGFLCRVFTDKFVDPLLCLASPGGLTLKKPHRKESDWYAFAVMYLESLLFVGPYGGVYLPHDLKQKIPHGLRPLHRITIWHPEVRYPKPAIPYKVLPDDLLHYFHEVFLQDKREIFPIRFLKEVRWTKCATCNTEHARQICPECRASAPAAVKETMVIRGTVKATCIFKTSGIIVFADHQNGKLNWIYHENNEYKREDGTVILQEPLDPHSRFRISGKRTIIGKNGFVKVFEPPVKKEFSVSSFGLLPIFDGNAEKLYWIRDGTLYREGQFGEERIGSVLDGQTLIWAGPSFGFGFYKAANMKIAFVFDATHGALNDTVALPKFPGQPIDADCVFTENLAWFLISSKENSKIINRCFLIGKNGAVEAENAAEEGDGSWLSSIRGKCAAGKLLFAATDKGIARLEADKGKITVTREFPDTESFVDERSLLFPDRAGIYVVRTREIKLLKMS